MKKRDIKTYAEIEKSSVIVKDGKKYLAMRIANHRPEAVTGLAVLAYQYDINGRSLGKIELSSSEVKNGISDFVWVPKTELDPKCDRCEAYITSVQFGDYAYALEGGELKLSYSDSTAGDRARRLYYAKDPTGDGRTVTANRVRFASGVTVMTVILLVLALALAIFQVEWFKAITFDFAVDGVIYTFATEDRGEGSDVVVTGYNGRSPTVKITDEISGHPVKEIQKGAFRGSAAIESLVIETESISIAQDAFRDCRNLRSVELIGVPSVGKNAFSGCTGLESVRFAGVKNIGDSAFSGCGIKSLVLGGPDWAVPEKAKPESTESEPKNAQTSRFVVSVGAQAFSGCPDIEDLKIYKDVDLMRAAGCFTASGIGRAYIEELDTSRSLVTLFGEKSAVREITIGYLDSIPTGLCRGFPYLTSFTAKVKTGRIGERAFEDCTSLKKLSLDKTVTAVGASAFKNCAFTSFDARALGTISPSAFAGCGKLTDIELSPELTEIGASAFAGCSSLSDMPLPPALATIGDRAFADCTALSAIYFPASVTSIGAYAFSGSGLSTVTVPETVTRIGKGAFSATSSLGNITVTHFGTLGGGQQFYELFGDTPAAVPSSLVRVTVTEPVSVADGAFTGCAGVKTVELPHGIEIIPSHCFSGCESLVNVITADDITAIGDYAFEGCKAFRTPYMPDTLVSIGQGAYKDCTGVTGLTVPDITVCRYAFSGMTGLTEITSPFISPSDGTLFHEFFSDDPEKMPSSLATVRFTGITMLPAGAMSGCASVRNVILPDTLLRICAGAFEYCNSIERLTVPEGAELDAGSLRHMDTLRELVIPTFAARFFEFFGVDQSAVPSTLKKVTLTPSGVSGIPTEAFYGCNNIAEVTVPEGVTAISDRAFRYCTSLNDITLPSSLISIGANAFENCTALACVVLPTNLTAIGDMAFFSCRKLYEVVNLSTSLSLSRGSTDNGYVAAYALKVSNSLSDRMETATVGEAKFVHGDDGWYLLKYEGSGVLRFPTGFIYNGTAVSSYEVMSEAFLGTSITEVYIGAGVRSIAADTFNSSVVKKIVFEAGCDVVSIGDRAFASCYMLETIESAAGARVGSYGEHVFNGCVNLTSAVLPAGATGIPAYGFYGCNMLSSITLPDTLISIGKYAFCNCSDMRRIVLPASLSSINDRAFDNCYRLYEVCYLGSAMSLSPGSSGYGLVCYNAVAVTHSLAESASARKTVNGYEFLQSGSGWVFVGGGTDSAPVFGDLGEITSYRIAHYAFENRSFTSITLGAGVTGVGVKAFSFNYDLSRLVLMNKTVDITYDSFYACSNNGGRYTVYFNGSSAEWTLSMMSSVFSYQNIKYYSDCVHTENVWTIKDGVIVDTVYGVEYKVKTEPTCTEPGESVYVCKGCGREMSSPDVISPLGHDMVDGVCTRCGTRLVTESVNADNFGTMFTGATNFAFSQDMIVSTNTAITTVARLTFVADRAMDVSFVYGMTGGTSGTTSDMLRIKYNGSIIEVGDVSSKNISFHLSSGDTLEIEFTKQSEDDDSAFVGQFVKQYLLAKGEGA